MTATATTTVTNTHATAAAINAAAAAETIQPVVAAATATAAVVLDIGQLIEEFCKDCRVRHLTDETIGRYRSALKIFAAFLGGRQRTALDIDKHLLKDFIEYRREQRVDQKTLEKSERPVHQNKD